MKRILNFISMFFRIGAASADGRAFVGTRGITPDNSAMWGMFGVAVGLNDCLGLEYNTVSSASQTVTMTASELVGGMLLRTGAPGGGVTETTPTAAQIIAALPNTIPLDGTFQKKVRILNSTGQTITLTAGSGVTLSGTMTVANGTTRDLLITVDSPTAVSITNLGAGTV